MRKVESRLEFYVAPAAAEGEDGALDPERQLPVRVLHPEDGDQHAPLLLQGAQQLAVAGGDLEMRRNGD